MSDTKQLRALRERVKKDKQDAFRAALELADGAATDQKANGKLEFALTRMEEHDRRLAALPEVEVVSEPDMYRRAGPHSFFRDVISAAEPPAPVYGAGDPVEARERLARHTKHEASQVEVTKLIAERHLAGLGIQARGGSDQQPPVQSRALSSAAGVGGELVPPKWMTELFAAVSRAPCPLKKLVTTVELPPGTLELHTPRFDTSAGVMPDQAENTVAPDQYSQTDALVTKVATFIGDALVSQQMYDRGGTFSDEIVLRDFAENYGQALAAQMMTGTGANGQMLGLLNVSTSPVNGVPGARVVTYTNATPTPSAVVQATAQCAAQISDTRERPPSAILTRGARWFWIAGSPDGSGNEPVQRPGTGVTAADDTGPFGPIASLPVYHDNTIPTNLGTGANQDLIVLVRARDIILLEDPLGPRFTAYLGTVLDGQLTVVLQWHTYTAAITNRYPAAIGTVQGTGLVVPSGF